MARPLCIYHGGCRDGFCAAWVVNRALDGEVDFHAGYYGQPPPDVAGRQVIVMDFSYQRDVMLQLEAASKSILVLDHHKTAEEALRGLCFVQFDMHRSGAGMAWDWYCSNEPRPWLVDYVEDRDLWRHALPDSEAVNAWIGALPFDFAAWDVEERCNLDEAKRKGAAVSAKVAQYVREASKNARRVVFEGYDVPIVNAPQIDISELLSELCEGEAFAMGWWQRADGDYQYSLRSRGDFDVSDLAVKHGGGGHKNAAGFQSRSMVVA